MSAALWPAAAATVFDAGVAAAAGAALTAHWVAHEYGARLAALARAALLAALGAHALLLLLQAASMTELPLVQALAEVPTVLGQTHYGSAWLGAFAALALASGLSWRSALPARPLLAALGLTLYAKGMASHAGAGGSFGFALLVHWSHLVAVSCWAGVVFAGVWCRLPQEPDSAAYGHALSRAATVALGVALASGIASAWFRLGGGDLSLDNPYLGLLLAKLLLVLCAAGLGGYNRWRGLPGLALPDPAMRAAAAWRFGAVMRVEAAVLLAVLALAALLGATPPEGA